MPFRTVGFFLEMCARYEWLIKILWILNDCRHGEPVGAEIRVAIEVFGDDSVLAIRHAVFAKVSGPHVCGHDFQTAGRRLLAALGADEFPGRHGMSLPCRCSRGDR